MSGSGYAIGLAIASYEWMAALTLLIVGKFFLPIFLKNHIYTMPQFLEQRYGTRMPHADGDLLARAVRLREPDLDHLARLDRGEQGRRASTRTSRWSSLGAFALLYQLRGGLKAVALTDIVQVTLLVLGGLLVVAYLTLTQIGGGAGVLARLRAR